MDMNHLMPRSRITKMKNNLLAWLFVLTFLLSPIWVVFGPYIHTKYSCNYIKSVEYIKSDSLILNTCGNEIDCYPSWGVTLDEKISSKKSRNIKYKFAIGLKADKEFIVVFDLLANERDSDLEIISYSLYRIENGSIAFSLPDRYLSGSNDKILTHDLDAPYQLKCK